MASVIPNLYPFFNKFPGAEALKITGEPQTEDPTLNIIGAIPSSMVSLDASVPEGVIMPQEYQMESGSDTMEHLQGAAGVRKQVWRECMFRALTDNNVGCYFEQYGRAPTGRLPASGSSMPGVLV